MRGRRDERLAEPPPRSSSCRNSARNAWDGTSLGSRVTNIRHDGRPTIGTCADSPCSAAAAATPSDGSTILIGGFGMAGMPTALIDALIQQGCAPTTDVLVQTLLERGAEADVAEAEAAIER